MARGPEIATAIARYLEDHRDEVVSVDDIANSVDGSRDGVQKVMLRLRTELDIRTVSAGRSWIYAGPLAADGQPDAVSEPPAPKVLKKPTAQAVALVRTVQPSAAQPGMGDYMEVIGTTQRGLLLRAEDGSVWQAGRL